MMRERCQIKIQCFERPTYSFSQVIWFYPSLAIAADPQAGNKAFANADREVD
jgi:hypothetical protein